jgi:hypothetical protein
MSCDQRLSHKGNKPMAGLRKSLRFSLLTFTALLGLIGAPGDAIAFEVTVSTSTYSDPAVGQSLDMQLNLSDIPEIAGIIATVIYNPHYYAFEEFTPGDLLEDVESLFNIPPSEADTIAVALIGGVTEDFTTSNQSPQGVLGTLRFSLLQSIPVSRDLISVLSVQLIETNGGFQQLNFFPGELGLEVTRRFSNRAFNFKVNRRDIGATIGWQTRFVGLDDTLRYRRSGDTAYALALNPLATSLSQRLQSGIRLLGLADLDPRQADNNSLDAFFSASDFSPLSAAFYDSLRQVQQTLSSRRREIALNDLEPQTTYQYTVYSVSLDGRPTPQETGTFRTRAEPDTRPIVGTDVDVQLTATTASASWLTNRPADTRFAVFLAGGDTTEVVFDGDDGSLVHNAPIDGLIPGREYSYLIRSRLIGVESLLESGQLDSSQIWLSKAGTFRTRQGREPLRLLEPPSQVLGPDNAVIRFRLNQITDAVVEYGLVAPGSGKITRDTHLSQADDAELYVWQQASTNLLDSHTITLSSLSPSTKLRYRIRVTTPDGDTLSTDPRGNEQWSGDLQLTTAAAGDTLPPRIVEGPAVIVRDILAVVRFKTDVETSARVFFGTRGGTYGTADEFEFVDQTPDGNPRFSQDHSVTISGLEAGAEYEYGIEFTAANGKTTSFEPSLNLAKSAGVLQPPGGAGRFVTRSVRDTRFPVILQGPSVASKTHASAIIEWVTDEPANSEVRFGETGTETNATSGSNKTRHRIQLTNLEPGKAYRFTAASTDASGNGSTQSAEAFFETDPDIDLTAPSLVGAPRLVHRTERSATIEWRTDEVSTGLVEFGPTSALDFRRKLQDTGRRHRITLTNLEPASSYNYRVSSSDLNNNGPTQSQVLQFTTAAQPDLAPPTMNNVRVAPGRNTAIVRWKTNEVADSFVDFGVGGNDLALAKAAASDAADAFFQQDGSLDQKIGSIEDVSDHEIVLTNLEPGTTYFLRAGSIDASDNPPVFSDVLAFTTPSDADVAPPAAPRDLTGEASFERVSLRWRANDELDLAGYNVYRRLEGTEFSLVETRVQDTTLVDAGLLNGATYEYRISAIDRSLDPNESAFSAILALIPSSDTAPSVPQRLTVDDASLQPTLSFDNSTPARQDAALSYTVQVSTLEGFGNVTASVSDLPQGEDGRTFWTLPRTLRQGQTYFWQVRAVEDGLPGAFSPAQFFVAGQSTELAADFDGDGQVNFDDFFAFADQFGRPAEADAARFDLDGDGQVGLGDFFTFADQFGLGGAGKGWAAPVALEEKANLWLETSGGTRDDNNIATVRILTDGTEALGGFGLVLQYDDASLRFIDARPGAGHLLQSQGGQAPLFRVLSQTPGRLVLGNALVSGQAPSGGGMLAELRFLRQGEATDAFFDLTEAFFYRDGEVTQVVSLASSRLTPKTYALGANFPNPFNPSTSIEYALPQTGSARLTIYDVLGRKVRTLFSEISHPAGIFTAAWDGRDTNGRAVGNGIYFYRLEAGKFSRTRKMALVK